MKKSDNKDFLLGLNIFSSRMTQLLGILDNQLQGGEGSTPLPMVVFTPNPEQLITAHEDQRFAKVLGSADLLVPDGIGLVVASRLLALKSRVSGAIVSESPEEAHPSGATPVAERIPGVEVVEQLLKTTGGSGATVLLIGGRGYGKENGMRIPYRFGATVYWTEGYRDAINPTGAEEEAVRDLIRSVKPAIVFVALGAPTQERWVVEHRLLLREVGVRVAMVVGGAFDMLLNKTPRAPQVLRTLNLEWLYRLVHQPWRWKRQLKLLKFIALLLRALVS